MVTWISFFFFLIFQNQTTAGDVIQLIDKERPKRTKKLQSCHPEAPTKSNKTIIISKSFRPHVVHVYKQSMHITRVKPSCHTWLVKEAHVWTKCDLVESCDKMTKICYIFSTWSWPLYLSVICWRKDKKLQPMIATGKSLYSESQISFKSRRKTVPFLTLSNLHIQIDK